MGVFQNIKDELGKQPVATSAAALSALLALLPFLVAVMSGGHYQIAALPVISGDRAGKLLTFVMLFPPICFVFAFVAKIVLSSRGKSGVYSVAIIYPICCVILSIVAYSTILSDEPARKMFRGFLTSAALSPFVLLPTLISLFAYISFLAVASEVDFFEAEGNGCFAVVAGGLFVLAIGTIVSFGALAYLII